MEIPGGVFGWGKTHVGLPGEDLEKAGFWGGWGWGPLGFVVALGCFF